MTPVTPDDEHPSVTRLRRAVPRLVPSSPPVPTTPDEPEPASASPGVLELVVVWSVGLLFAVACWAAIAWLVREVIL